MAILFDKECYGFGWCDHLNCVGHGVIFPEQTRDEITLRRVEGKEVPTEVADSGVHHSVTAIPYPLRRLFHIR